MNDNNNNTKNNDIKNNIYLRLPLQSLRYEDIAFYDRNNVVCYIKLDENLIDLIKDRYNNLRNEFIKNDLFKATYSLSQYKDKLEVHWYENHPEIEYNKDVEYYNDIFVYDLPEEEKVEVNGETLTLFEKAIDNEGLVLFEKRLSNINVFNDNIYFDVEIGEDYLETRQIYIEYLLSAYESFNTGLYMDIKFTYNSSDIIEKFIYCKNLVALYDIDIVKCIYDYFTNVHERSIDSWSDEIMIHEASSWYELGEELAFAIENISDFKLVDYVDFEKYAKDILIYGIVLEDRIGKVKVLEFIN